MKIAATVVLGFAVLIMLSSCQRGSSNPPNAGSSNAAQPLTPPPNATVNVAAERTNALNRPRIDACELLTTSEIAAIQNESVLATKLSGAPDKGFDVSQCFFTLETFANSISLRVTQKRDGNGARDPREFWRLTFDENDGSQEDDRERERARKEAREKFDREEEEESAPPMRVAGIGDDAYLMGDQVGGALYVLKGHNYVRISVGGAGDRNTKIRKSTRLAQKVIDRLSS